MAISGRARMAGVMGWPVAYSLSPALHNAWFARHGIDGAYVPLPVRAEDVALAFRALPRLGFLGWNVTVPHKEAAFRLADEHDPAARRMGAVNTILVRPDGSLLGRNTDGLGFLANLRQQAPGWRPAGGPAVLLGTGGAARAVAMVLAEAGVLELRLVNRTPERARGLAADLAGTGAAVSIHGWEARARTLEGAALLVQCTSLGMRGQGRLELSLDALPAGAVVADLVYVPLETELLAAARARGNPVVDGLGMLLHQAVPGFEHWGGVTPEVDPALRAMVLAAMAGR